MELSLNPVKSVQSAFDKPNLSYSIIFILLPAIIAAIGTIIMGFGANITAYVVSTVIGIIAWIILSAVLYVLGFLFEGRFLKGKMAGIMCSLSLIWLVLAILTLVGLLFAMVFIPADVYKTIASAQKGQITQDAAYTKISQIMASNQTNDIAAIIGLIVSVLLFAMVLFIAFLVVREVCPKSVVKQIVVFVIFLAIWLALASLAAKI